MSSLLFDMKYSLGQGDIGHMFHEPPDNIHDREGRGQRKTEVGFKGFMADKIAGISGNKKKIPVKANKKTSAAPAVAKTDTLNSKGSSTSNKSKDVKLSQQKSSPSSSSSSSGSKTAAERLQERKNTRAMKKQQKERATASAGR